MLNNELIRHLKYTTNPCPKRETTTPKKVALLIATILRRLVVL